MESLDQKCGCGNSNELISLQLKVLSDNCSCQTAGIGTVPAIKHFIMGNIKTPAGQIPQVTTELNWKDYFGAFKVRWGIKRNQYRVEPGLYAIGTPSERSDVLVTANYKLTFDIVRKNLTGLNMWLLVLDTKGVNVWCSAGKGNFGTAELVKRIGMTNLDKIVMHRRLILPQLGATGVAAHEVKNLSGFTVLYGPVRITDIKLYINARYKATKEMRLVRFDIYDRIKLIPNDIVYNMRYLLAVAGVLAILSGINTDGISFRQILSNLVPVFKVVALGYVAGLVLTPMLLPYIPFRNFSFKGLTIGAVISIAALLNHSFGDSVLINLAAFLFISGFSSFLAMNFTGASTYTSLAGVKKEMRIAVPIQIALSVAAGIMIVVDKIIS